MQVAKRPRRLGERERATQLFRQPSRGRPVDGAGDRGKVVG
jgi:hypothetical protein